MSKNTASTVFRSLVHGAVVLSDLGLLTVASPAACRPGGIADGGGVFRHPVVAGVLHNAGRKHQRAQVPRRSGSQRRDIEVIPRLLPPAHNRCGRDRTIVSPSAKLIINTHPSRRAPCAARRVFACMPPAFLVQSEKGVQDSWRFSIAM